MIGVCGTCARPAEATAGNEGYSDCCNDRIEYGVEAAETVARANCDHAAAGTKIVVEETCGFDRVWTKTKTVVCAGCGEYVGEAS